MQNTPAAHTNTAPRAAQDLSHLVERMSMNGPVFTMPISVKPKTREPTSFTDNRFFFNWPIFMHKLIF
uniref:Uncharacterized protein n=1 Tax=Caenorhabditis japonica TaxID=281687 RepID=A0A8R1IR11_CAEJA